MANKKDAKNLSENCQGSVCKTHRPPIRVFLCTQRPNSRLMIKQSAAHTQSKKKTACIPQVTFLKTNWTTVHFTPVHWFHLQIRLFLKRTQSSNSECKSCNKRTHTFLLGTYFKGFMTGPPCTPCNLICQWALKRAAYFFCFTSHLILQCCDWSCQLPLWCESSRVVRANFGILGQKKRLDVRDATKHMWFRTKL